MAMFPCNIGSSGGTLPDTLVFWRNQGGGAGVCWIPKVIVDQYSYYMITGTSNGYMYDEYGYHATSVNTKISLSTLSPGSNGIGFGWSGNGNDTWCTLYKN